MDDGPDDPAQRETTDHVDGRMRADIEPAPPRPRPREARRCAARSDRGTGSQPCHPGRNHVGRRNRQHRRHRTVYGDAEKRSCGGRSATIALIALASTQASRASERDKSCEAQAARKNTDDRHDRHRSQRTELHDTDQWRARSIRKLVDQPEQGDLNLLGSAT